MEKVSKSNGNAPTDLIVLSDTASNEDTTGAGQPRNGHEPCSARGEHPGGLLGRHGHRIRGGEGQLPNPGGAVAGDLRIGEDGRYAFEADA